MNSALLEALGEPADCVVWLDYETFYSKEFQLKKLTTEAYVRDPRFEVIGVGVAIGDRPPVWLEAHEFRAWAAKVPWHRVALGAHNTPFDGFISSHHFGIRAAVYLDTLSMGRGIHGIEVGGSLKKLASHYGSGEKGDEVLNALGKRRADFTPEEWRRYGDYCCNDVALTRDIFWKMVPAIPEQELFTIDQTLRCFIHPTLELDREMAEKALAEEKEKKAALLARVSADRSVLMSNEQFAALLSDMGVEPPMKLSEKKTATARRKDPDAPEVWVPAFAKTDPGMKDLLEHERDEIRWLAEARLGVKSTITETRAERYMGIASRGRLPVFLKYCGAHTGRWAAGDNSNFQNLNRKGYLRKMLVAPEGNVLVASDSAQIEARTLAWVFGHTELVLAFAQGRDVYSEFATVAFGRPITKKNEVERFVGKTCVLGLGYGLGFSKLAQTFLAGAMGGPPVKFTRVEAAAMKVDVGEFASDPKKVKRLRDVPTRLSPDEMLVHGAVCDALVQRYRASNEPIVQGWKAMDAVIATMWRGEKMRFGPGNCLVTLGNAIGLPSGRKLRYPDLEIDEGGASYRGRHGKGKAARVKLYGGKLTENIVQALARDVVAEQALWAKSKGKHLVTTTHDELVALAAESEGKATLDLMLGIMRTPPPWAPGLPLNAEGGFARSYGAAK